MNIQTVYGWFLPRFRRKRMERLRETMEPTSTTRMVDVGGYPKNWPEHLFPGALTIVNLDCEGGSAESARYAMVRGDGCNLPFADASFDIAYSNSVIEHLFTFEQQARFAAETRRVGRRVWVQTPARWFPVEPHLIAPFVHYLPTAWQRRLLRHFTVWGLVAKPTEREVDGFLAEVRLLTFREMLILFPDCEIRKERFLGLTKAFVAVRR